MPLQDKDFTITQVHFENGVYEYSTGELFSPPASGSGIFIWNATSSTGQCMAIADFVVTLFQSSDMAAMKASMSMATVASSGLFSDLSSKPTTLNGYGITDGVTSTGLTSTLTAYATTSAVTSGLSGKFNNPSGTTSQYIRGDGSFATFPTIPAAQVQSDWNAVSGLGVILNKPTIPAAPTQNDNVSRSLNANYTVSSTQRARLNYSVNVSWNLAALLSGSASAFLEYSTNAGSTWVTVSQVSKNIGLLTFAGADDLNLTGDVPANALTRIRTTSTNMTVTYVRGQEVIG